MNSWEIFNETALPNKEDCYNGLNMEDIADIDYRHAKKVFRELKMNNLGDYHDLYVQNYTLLWEYTIMRILEINSLKYMSLILFISYQHQD